MYNGTRMYLGVTSALRRYSCEDFPLRTTRSCPLLKKEEIRSNN